MGMQTIRWKGFPKPSFSVKDAIRNVKKLTDGKDMLYDAIQLPHGQIIGLKYPLGTGTIYWVDPMGKTIDLLDGEVPMKGILKSIEPIKKAVNIGQREELCSEVTFWFCLGGGKSEDESIYGSDSLEPFLFLFMVLIDGTIAPYHTWEKCGSEEMRIFNMQDMPKTVVNLGVGEDVVRHKIKTHLSYDKIEKKILGPGVNKKPAHALLLIPQKAFLRQRPQSWCLIKTKTKYVSS